MWPTSFICKIVYWEMRKTDWDGIKWHLFLEELKDIVTKKYVPFNIKELDLNSQNMSVWGCKNACKNNLKATL